MGKPTPNLGVAKPKPDLSALRNSLRETATPATHDEGPQAETEEAPARRKRGGKKEAVRTQLIGVHLSPDVGKQLRQIALDEDTDMKALLIEAINTLFKSRGKPQIASDPKDV